MRLQILVNKIGNFPKTCVFGMWSLA